MVSESVTSPVGVRFDWLIFISLLAVLTVSVVVFNWQVRRWTKDRAWYALLDWGRRRGFTLSQVVDDAPEPFDRLAGARIVTSLRKAGVVVAQIETRAGTDVERARWHVLVCETASGVSWAATALRPALAPTSVFDLFSLGSFPGMGESERFVIFGTDSTAARQLSSSQARALLPPDVGLLLAGTRLALDFSARPFDPIELDRMTALAEQLVRHLAA